MNFITFAAIVAAFLAGAYLQRLEDDHHVTLRQVVYAAKGDRQ